MSNNRRIYYASYKAGIAPLGSSNYTTLRGLQTLGMTTTFNLEQVFEIGQLAIFENIEGIPDVEVTMEKVLDGSAPLYTLATQLGTAATLSGRSNARSTLAVSIYDDTVDSATGGAAAEVQLSGLYTSSVSYNVNSDGNATESLTLVGNDKVWVNQVANTSFANYTDDPFADNDHSPKAISGSGGVNRREDVLFVYDAAPGVDVNGSVSGDGTILPTELPGISSSGTNDKSSDEFGAHMSSFSASVDLGREELFELGRRGPYFRFVNFPVEVTTELTMTASSGDLISATAEGINSSDTTCVTGTNLENQTIRLHMCEGLQLNLGKKNKLSSVGVTGGDAGGGNVEVTYTYTNYNDFDVFHPQDPNKSDDAFSVGEEGSRQF